MVQETVVSHFGSRGRRRLIGAIGAGRVRRIPLGRCVIALCVVMASAIVPSVLFTSPASASGSIYAIGSLAETSGTGVTTLTVNPQNVGDAFALSTMVVSNSVSLSSVSGGGATWQKLTSMNSTPGGIEEELWLGTITTTGPSTITVTYSGGVSGFNSELDAQEFTNGTGASTTWSKDVTGTSENTSSTNVAFPSLTPTGTGELYAGFANVENASNTGTTSGFTYDVDQYSNSFIYNPSVSGAVAPSTTQSPAGTSEGIGALITATGSGGGGSSGTMSHVGSEYSNSGTGTTTLAVTPATVGDAFVLATFVGSTTPSVSSVSGGGVTTWSKLTSAVDSVDGCEEELWLGTVTTAGSSTITVNFSSSVSSDLTEFIAQEYSSSTGTSTTWAKDVAGTSANTTSSTTVTYPSLNPSGSNELYAGYSIVGQTGEAGSTSGFSYDVTPLYNVFLYNPSVSATVAPTAAQTPASTSDAIGALITATGSGGPPVVTGVSPSSGTLPGGTTVTVTGSNFTSGSTVDFGSTPATGVSVLSSSSITASAPAGGTANTVNVTVSTPQGTSTTSGSDDFSYSIGSCVCEGYVASLATTTVNVYNASPYPNSRVTDLVQWADRGMATQDPLDYNVAGEMHSNDLVVATETGLYWIDATDRGGLMTGEWPLDVDGSGNANFEYIVGVHNWGPNMLFPGSNGNDAAADEGDAGFGIRLIATGGTDGSTVSGEGTFDPTGSVDLSYEETIGDYQQLFQFTGYLTQEYNGTQTMKDSNGDTANVQYIITYRFNNANDTSSTYTGIDGSAISDQYVNRIEVTLTPENTTGSCESIYGVHCIYFKTFDIGDDLQHIPTAQPNQDLYMLSSDDALADYEPTNPPPSGCLVDGLYTQTKTFYSLCSSIPSNDQNLIQEPTTLPTTVPAGDESVMCSAFCGRSIAYFHPSGFALPARDSAVENTYLNSLSLETQYFNSDSGDAQNSSWNTWYNNYPNSAAETAVDQLIRYF